MKFLGKDMMCSLRAALVAAALAPHARGQGPEVGKSVFWNPYAYDVQTSGLFHFDGDQPVSLGDILDKIGKDDPAGGMRLPDAPAGGAGRTSANAVPMGRPLSLMGTCEEEPKAGRFGGGLRLSGRDGRVAVQAGPGRGWTLDAWFRPARLPEAGATLVDLPLGARSVRVSLMADGRLAMQWPGAKEPALTVWRCKAGEWFHLALVWQPATFHEDNVTSAELLVLVNGKPVLRSGVQPADAFQRTLAQAASVGNDAKGQSGFDGWLDELRLSRVAREFYFWDLGWADTGGELRRPEGQPFFRDERDLLLHLGFDRTLEPTTAPEGLTFPKLGPEALGDTFEPNRWARHFGDGVRREALLLKPGGVDAKYQGRGFALPAQGTLAFWFRPLNWNNSTRWNLFAGFEQKRVPLFHMHQEGGKEAVLTFSLWQTPNSDAYRLLDVNPGRWVHLAVVWDGKQDTWYADGKPWPHWGSFDWTRRGWDADKPLNLVFERDAESKTTGKASGCTIDDFRVYPRPLAPSEIRNLAALHDRRAELVPLPAVEMKVAYNGVIGYTDVELYPLHPDYRHAAEARVGVTAAGAAAPLATRTFDLTANPSPQGRIETGPMDFGEFHVTADVRDAAGKTLFDDRFTFTREPPPWWKNTIGISDRVMPGWTPIVVKEQGADGAVVGVVLRDVNLGASGMPEQVVAHGEPVLAGPVSMIATVGERTAPLEPVPGALRIETRGEVRADFTGRSEGLGVAAEVNGYIEFDGMMWFEITLKPSEGGAAALDRLAVRIPYTDKAATLTHWWSGPSWFRSSHHVGIGATPRKDGVIFSSTDKSKVTLLSADGWGHKAMDFRGSFMPYVMLTGDRYGMAWFGENDQGWTYSTNTPAISIEREGETVTLVLNVITETVALDEPRTFAFGLHPIPVKPLDRQWRHQPGVAVNMDSFCGFNLKGAPGATQFYLHPENMDWKAARARHPRPGPERTPIAPGALDPAAIRRPARNVDGLYHALLYQSHVFPDHTREWGEAIGAQRYTPELVDYSVWIWNEWVKRGLADGIYFDECWNEAVTTWPSPVTYKRADGGVQPGWHFRLIRERMKRTRQVFHDYGLSPVLTGHSTHTYYIPYHSFFDTLLDGEHFFMDDPNVAVQQDQNLMQFWPPDRLRFNNPEKWGIVGTGMFMGLLPGPWKERWAPFKQLSWRQGRAFTGMMLLNDLLEYHLPWGCYSHGGGVDLDDAWLRECRIREDTAINFVGYWDAATPATHGHKDLYVSAWKRDGWGLAVLVNYGKERIEAEVAFDLAKLGLAGVEPVAVRVRDVDPTLLSYFDDDVTTLKKPDLRPPDDPEGMAEELDAFVAALEKPKSLAERKAADPDGKFEWKDGVLRCPVRRYDFRLFEFKGK